jgi:tetratricopeptide (TPR) repeat protein
MEANVLNNYAYLLLKSKESTKEDYKRAHSMIENCIKLTPESSKSAPFLDTLAISYFMRKDYTQALYVQKQALALAPSNTLQPYLKRYDIMREIVKLPAKQGFFDE